MLFIYLPKTKMITMQQWRKTHIGSQFVSRGLNLYWVLFTLWSRQRTTILNCVLIFTTSIFQIWNFATVTSERVSMKTGDKETIAFHFDVDKMSSIVNRNVNIWEFLLRRVRLLCTAPLAQLFIVVQPLFLFACFLSVSVPSLDLFVFFDCL